MIGLKIVRNQLQIMNMINHIFTPSDVIGHVEFKFNNSKHLRMTLTPVTVTLFVVLVVVRLRLR